MTSLVVQWLRLGLPMQGVPEWQRVPWFCDPEAPSHSGGSGLLPLIVPWGQQSGGGCPPAPGGTRRRHPLDQRPVLTGQARLHRPRPLAAFRAVDLIRHGGKKMRFLVAKSDVETARKVRFRTPPP